MDVRLNIEFDIFICLAWSSWISAVLGVKSRSIPYSLIFYDYVLVLFVLCVCAMCLFPYGSDGEFLQIIIHKLLDRYQPRDQVIYINSMHIFC